MDINRVRRLYPQYERSEDRRKQNIPVAIDRRSGQDRRGVDRVSLDKQLTRDIFEVKNKVAQMENFSPKFFVDNVVKQAPTFSSMANNTKDMLVKEQKPDPTEMARLEAKIQEKEATKFQIGLIAAALTAAVGLSFMSGAGAVIALGTGLYIGSRVLKTIITKEVKDDDENKV